MICQRQQDFDRMEVWEQDLVNVIDQYHKVAEICNADD